MRFVGGAAVVLAVALAAFAAGAARAAGPSSYDVFFSTDSGQIYSWEPGQTAPVPVTSGSWPRLSPDGRYLAFHRAAAPITTSSITQSDIWVRNLTTGAETDVFANGDYADSYSWLPDSSKFVFDYLCGIDEVAPDGSGLAQIPTHGGCYEDAPSVDPANPALLAVQNDSGTTGATGTAIENTASGTYTLVAPDTKGLDWPQFSPDGTALVRNADGALWVDQTDALGKGAVVATGLLSSDATNMPAAWTSDGAWLITADAQNDLVAFAADGSSDGTGTVLFAVDPALYGHIDWVGSANLPVNAGGGAGSAPSASVTATVAPGLTVSLDKASLDFGTLLPGATASRSLTATVTSNDGAGYQLSVARTAFTPKDLPFTVACSACGLGATAIPTSGLQTVVSTSGPSANAGDAWATTLALGPIPASAPSGSYASTLTFTLVGL